MLKCNKVFRRMCNMVWELYDNVQVFICYTLTINLHNTVCNIHVFVFAALPSWALWVLSVRRHQRCARHPLPVTCDQSLTPIPMWVLPRVFTLEHVIVLFNQLKVWLMVYFVKLDCVLLQIPFFSSTFKGLGLLILIFHIWISKLKNPLGYIILRWYIKSVPSLSF